MSWVQLRKMLSDLQRKALSRADVEPDHSLELVDYISQVGFRLVDEMEGLVAWCHRRRLHAKVRLGALPGTLTCTFGFAPLIAAPHLADQRNPELGV